MKKRVFINGKGRGFRFLNIGFFIALTSVLILTAIFMVIGITETISSDYARLYSLKAVNNLNDIINKPFKCATATPEEIRSKCIEKGIKDDDIDFLIKSHRLKHYRKTLAEEYMTTVDTIKNRKIILTRKLENT